MKYNSLVQKRVPPKAPEREKGKNRMKKILSVVIAMLLALSLVACGGDSSSAADSASNAAGSGSSSASGSYATSLEDIKAKGQLVIGLDDTFAPMGFRDADGNLVGFDIDLAIAVCAELGVEPVFQPIKWSAKEMELSTGKVDCLWNGLSSTPERQETLSMSDAYLNNKIIVMTNKGVEIATKEDLANYNIGVQAESSALEVVQTDDVYESIKDKITEYDTYDQVVMDMQAGRLDAMIVDEVLGQYKNTQLGDIFEVAPFDFGDDLYAIGFRKSDTELTGAVNDALAACIESGKAAEISEKWFGEDIVLR